MRPIRHALPALAGAAIVLAGCGSSSSSSSTAPASSSTTASTQSTAKTQSTASSPSTSSTQSTTSSTASTATQSTPTTAQAPTTSTPVKRGQVGPEGIPMETGAWLGLASTTLPGTTVDGIQCAPLEQLAYHIHAHLQVYANGKPRQLPPAIGMNGPVAQQTRAGPFYSARKCIYWLHTHTADGIIHIESPTKRIYTLGDFFDEWHQPLSAHQVATASGPVTAFVNGQRWKKNVRDIPLNSHFEVQLDVGTPVVPFQPISFGNSGL